jgi:hypothetical protein
MTLDLWTVSLPWDMPLRHDRAGSRRTAISARIRRSHSQCTLRIRSFSRGRTCQPDCRQAFSDRSDGSRLTRCREISRLSMRLRLTAAPCAQNWALGVQADGLLNTAATPTIIGREDGISAPGPASPVLGWFGRKVGILGFGLTS